MISAKDFSKRSDLEDFISAEFGQDIEKNKSLAEVIIGTEEELKELQLSDTTTIFGIRCQTTDFPTKNKVKKKK